ncbi:hypothetical protein BD310DRAFT_318280 [Dichomitus squalens]|uniref:Secreted protein n=1 Tax=Dichomitus squalens TaxID=114155 RepID=A0A4Q9PCE5_9APHY|nr:hypothetical protein BD310DRAFT_318280 [Dichomitus squalens]
MLHMPPSLTSASWSLICVWHSLGRLSENVVAVRGPSSSSGRGSSRCGRDVHLPWNILCLRCLPGVVAQQASLHSVTPIFRWQTT